MTPLELPAFMTGTVAGMTVWGIVYASLGGASRSLLKSGVDLEELIGGEMAITKCMIHMHPMHDLQGSSSFVLMAKLCHAFFFCAHGQAMSCLPSQHQ